MVTFRKVIVPTKISSSDTPNHGATEYSTEAKQDKPRLISSSRLRVDAPCKNFVSRYSDPNSAATNCGLIGLVR